MAKLARKHIDVTFQLGQGQFGTSGFTQVTFSGLRVQCDIAMAGALFKGQLNLRIYGMTLSQMNQLAKVGRIPTSVRQNLVAISAGDDENGMSQIYQGSISLAWADFSAMPEVAFMVEAQSGYWESLAPTPAVSYQGTISVVNAALSIATAMGMKFQNWGVTGVLYNPVFPGSAWDQLASLVRQANINCIIDRGVVVIWPRGGYRGALPSIDATPNFINTQDGEIPTISAATGMKGYPRFNATGITVETIFDPALYAGGLVNIVTSLRPTADTWGPWIVNTIAHNLESERPGGNWFSTLECSVLGNTVVQGGAQ